MNFKISDYYSLGDTWVVLHAEYMYIKSFFKRIGHLSREEQVFNLLENLEKKGNIKKFSKINISLFYLMLEISLKPMKVSQSPSSTDIPEIPKKTACFSINQKISKKFTTEFFITQLLACIKELPPLETTEENKDKIHNLSITHKVFFDFLILVILQTEDAFVTANHKLFYAVLSVAFDQIKFSLSNPHCNLKRVTKLLEVVITKLFRQELGSLGKELSDAEKTEIFEKITLLVNESEQREEKDEESQFEKILELSTSQKIETFFYQLQVDKRSPLSSLIVVGLLRAMLKLGALTISPTAKKVVTCYDSNLEFQSNYEYMIGFLSKHDKVSQMYRETVNPSKTYGISTFLYRSLGIVSADPTDRENFMETVCLQGYIQAKGLKLMLYPDPIKNELGKNQFFSNFQEKISTKTTLASSYW